jgi:inorganic pyrophosphatase
MHDHPEFESQLISHFSPFFTAHPWHGVDIGKKAPQVVVAYIEIGPSDTIKYELDKASGMLKVNRPQKYSNYCPALYGFIPQTYCGENVGKFCARKLGQDRIIGDGDPLDICILSEKPIQRSNILVEAIPIGGFRAIDGRQADDKIIAVFKEDLVYGKFKDIKECPSNLIDRLRHYFLTYKEVPGENQEQTLVITHTYGHEEAQEVIRLAQADYQKDYKDFYDKFLRRL